VFGIAWFFLYPFITAFTSTYLLAVYHCHRIDTELLMFGRDQIIPLSCVFDARRTSPETWWLPLSLSCVSSLWLELCCFYWGAWGKADCWMHSYVHIFSEFSFPILFVTVMYILTFKKVPLKQDLLAIILLEAFYVTM